ncbi:MAG: hypothetical protein ACYC5F_09745 [Thermoleophilia bacterium]
MPWYLLKSGTPFFSETPRTDLGPEIPEPGSEPESTPPASKETPPKESKKK